MNVLSKKNATKIVNSTVLTRVENNNIRLSYPIFELYGFRINIQPSVYSVHLQKTANNESNLLGADMVSLMYKAGKIGAWTPEAINEYEKRVYEYFQT